MRCQVGGCEEPAVLRAWFTRPCCGYVESITPVCAEGHGGVASRRTLCDGCKQWSLIKITKRKRIRTNHRKGAQ